MPSRLEPEKNTNDRTGCLSPRKVAPKVRGVAAFLDGRLLSQYLEKVAQALAVGDGIEKRLKVVPIVVVAGHRGSRGPTDPLSS